MDEHRIAGFGLVGATVGSVWLRSMVESPVGEPEGTTSSSFKDGPQGGRCVFADWRIDHGDRGSRLRLRHQRRLVGRYNYHHGLRIDRAFASATS